MSEWLAEQLAGGVPLGLAEWLLERFAEWKQVAVSGVGLGVIVLVAATFLATRQAVKTLTMLVLGGLVLWTVANTDWLVDRIGEETGKVPTQVEGLAGRPPPPPAAG